MENRIVSLDMLQGEVRFSRKPIVEHRVVKFHPSFLPFSAVPAAHLACDFFLFAVVVAKRP